jgi:hypothetical protein
MREGHAVASAISRDSLISSRTVVETCTSISYKDYAAAGAISKDSLIGSHTKCADVHTETTELLGLSRVIAQSLGKTDELKHTEKTTSCFGSLKG